MNKSTVQLHTLKIQMQVIGCWYLAELLEKMIKEEASHGDSNDN